MVRGPEGIYEKPSYVTRTASLEGGVRHSTVGSTMPPIHFVKSAQKLILLIIPRFPSRVLWLSLSLWYRYQNLSNVSTTMSHFFFPPVLNPGIRVRRPEFLTYSHCSFYGPSRHCPLASLLARDSQIPAGTKRLSPIAMGNPASPGRCEKSSTADRRMWPIDAPDSASPLRSGSPIGRVTSDVEPPWSSWTKHRVYSEPRPGPDPAWVARRLSGRAQTPPNSG